MRPQSPEDSAVTAESTQLRFSKL